MQIVIDIDYKVYCLLKYFEKGLGLDDKKDDDVKTALMRAVVNGTPLPEHHGRLIDADALEQEMIIAEGKAEGNCDYYMSDTIDRAKEYIIDAETIVPATKEEKHCKACKYSDNGMINVESERCKACYYDGRLGGNCLFVPKQTATKEGDEE